MKRIVIILALLLIASPAWGGDVTDLMGSFNKLSGQYIVACTEIERLKAENAELREFKDWYRKAYGDPERNGWVAHSPLCRWEIDSVISSFHFGKISNYFEERDRVNYLLNLAMEGGWEPYSVTIHEGTIRFWLKRRVCE